MAMYMSAVKKFKSNPGVPLEMYHEAIINAGSEMLPWRDNLPANVVSTIEILSYSANTSPDFVFLALLTATATTMGPSTTVQCLDYEEPVNVFTMCIGYPGSGKTQALKIAIESPINRILASWNSGVILDDFTREGFRKLLQAKDGRVLIASDEIAGFFSSLDSGSGADRYLLCRLFDCSSWTKTTGQGNSLHREEVAHTHCSIFGFIQPGPFFSKVLPSLPMEDDGLYDRFLLCCPRTMRLKCEALQEWQEKKKELPISDFKTILQAINDRHDCQGPVTYTMTEEARSAYKPYYDQSVDAMNDAWETGGYLQISCTKDGRQAIRIAALLHALLQGIQEVFNPNDEHPICTSISEDTMKTAIAITKYCSYQRNLLKEAYNDNTKLVTERRITSTWSTADLQQHILLCPGPFVTGRLVRRWAPQQQQAFARDKHIEAFESLVKGGLGSMHKFTEKETVYYKPLPEDNFQSKVLQKINSKATWEEYKAKFTHLHHSDWSPNQFNKLLDAAPEKEKLKDTYKFTKM